MALVILEGGQRRAADGRRGPLGVESAALGQHHLDGVEHALVPKGGASGARKNCMSRAPPPRSCWRAGNWMAPWHMGLRL